MTVGADHVALPDLHQNVWPQTVPKCRRNTKRLLAYMVELQDQYV